MKKLPSRFLSLLLAAVLIILIPTVTSAGAERASLEVDDERSIEAPDSASVRASSEVDDEIEDINASLSIPVQTRFENAFGLSWMIKDHPGYDTAYTQARSAQYNYGVATENHVVLDEEHQQIRFFGYNIPPYLDMCYNNDCILGLSYVEFTLSPEQMDFHVLRETGFLFNGRLDGDKYTGYALILKVPQAYGTAATLSLYYLENEVLNYDNFNPGSHLLVKQFQAGISVNSKVKYHIVLVRDPYANGAFTITITGSNGLSEFPIGSFTENDPKISDPEFGFFTGYYQHNCSSLTRIYYEGLKIETDDHNGDVIIDKWVDGESILTWIRKNEYDLDDIISLLQFDLYETTGNGNPLGLHVATGSLWPDGKIHFNNCITHPGWYAIVETLIGNGQVIFEPQPALYIYIDESLNFTSAPLSIVSRAGDPKISLSGGQVFEVLNDPGTGIPNIVDFWKTNMVDFNKYFSQDAKFIWDAEDTFQYGVSGSRITVIVDLNVTEQQIRDGVTLSFACDNAAIINIDKITAPQPLAPIAWSTVAFTSPRPIVFTDLSWRNFIGEMEAWSKIESLTLTKEDGLRPGRNRIRIDAANSRQTQNTGTPNDGYNRSNNPCGLIFQIDAPGVVFENKTKPAFSDNYYVLYSGRNKLVASANNYVNYNDVNHLDNLVVGFGVPVTAYYTPYNKPWQDVWNDGLVNNGYGDLYNEMLALASPYGIDVKWVWDTADPTQPGSNTDVSFTPDKFWIGEIKSPVTMYLAADNGAKVIINGQIAGYTYLACDEDLNLNGHSVYVLYSFDVTDYLKENSYNTIEIVARNLPRPNMSNPAGVLYFLKVDYTCDHP